MRLPRQQARGARAAAAAGGRRRRRRAAASSSSRVSLRLLRRRRRVISWEEDWRRWLPSSLYLQELSEKPNQALELLNSCCCCSEASSLQLLFARMTRRGVRFGGETRSRKLSSESDVYPRHFTGTHRHKCTSDSDGKHTEKRYTATATACLAPVFLGRNQSVTADAARVRPSPSLSFAFAHSLAPSLAPPCLVDDSRP